MDKEKEYEEVSKALFPSGDNHYAFKTKKGNWVLGYTNDYPLQHGNGQQVSLPEDVASKIQAAFINCFKTEDGYFIDPVSTSVYFYPMSSHDGVPCHGLMTFIADQREWRNYREDKTPVFFKRDNCMKYILKRESSEKQGK